MNVEDPLSFWQRVLSLLLLVLVVAATLLAGSELRIHGVNLNPTRTGLLDVLERMGARITIFNRRMLAGEPSGDLEIRSAQLTATSIKAAEVPGMVDELPVFALAAGMARGEFREIPIPHAVRMCLAPLLLAAIWRTTFARFDPVPYDYQGLIEAHVTTLLRGLAREGLVP